MHLNAAHPALSEARTIHQKMRRDALLNKSSVLKPISSNSKVGKKKTVITKGKWKGMPMYSLTLEERATCPSSCIRWKECYGNGMPFAHRFETDNLIPRLRQELNNLAKKHPNGFVVRLHILGDFYSVPYVSFWNLQLWQHQNLYVFGYTARTDEIWNSLKTVRRNWPDRFWVRQSLNKQYNADSPLEIFASEPMEGSLKCPEQTKQTESCLTCGLCWSTKQTISFTDHDKVNG